MKFYKRLKKYIIGSTKYNQLLRMDTTYSNTIKNKICTQCKSKVGNDEILVSVWRYGMTSVLNCTNCQNVKAATKI